MSNRLPGEEEPQITTLLHAEIKRRQRSGHSFRCIHSNTGNWDALETNNRDVNSPNPMALSNPTMGSIQATPGAKKRKKQECPGRISTGLSGSTSATTPAGECPLALTLSMAQRVEVGVKVEIAGEGADDRSV